MDATFSLTKSDTFQPLSGFLTTPAFSRILKDETLLSVGDPWRMIIYILQCVQHDLALDLCKVMIPSHGRQPFLDVALLLSERLGNIGNVFRLSLVF